MVVEDVSDSDRSLGREQPRKWSTALEEGGGNIPFCSEIFRKMPEISRSSTSFTELIQKDLGEEHQILEFDDWKYPLCADGKRRNPLTHNVTCL